MNARYALINATPWIRDGGRERKRKKKETYKQRERERERERSGWMTSSLLSSRWRGVDKVSPRFAIGGQDQAGCRCYFLLWGAGASLSRHPRPLSPSSLSQPAASRCPLCAFYSLPAPGSPIFHLVTFGRSVARFLGND